MARNVEIKARVERVAAVAAAVAAIAEQGPVQLYQDDTFFVCPNGRLKLRAFTEMDGQLIFYRRLDQRGPKESFYVISPIKDPASLREVLSCAYGQAAMSASSGPFISWEELVCISTSSKTWVILSSLRSSCERTSQRSMESRRAHLLIDRLGIRTSQLIDGAYVDLLASQRA